MVTYLKEGNIFNIPGISNYAHGCNCAGAMGKGIAVQFKEKFPEMYLQYKKLCKSGAFTLGEVFMYNYGDGRVFNLGTQQSWTTKAEISAVNVAIGKMLQLAAENQVTQIALPKIGAGLGKLDWESVKRVINEQATTYPEIDLFVVENFKEA
ncbi:macro domain-containing protein [Chitinophaga ginsengisegetis]|uniref:macro domain-containing protein n=1 Tax=Chitinophaga ginsengisegetis TaxID=393003 RepID=UPI000DBA65F7|nr:macro domain-containing protein [Chitinophaga ginsengisegetis]MDR6568818.1 O-acetyl-ADP-ribose deacetylase (regulator of RNase III) [Chitinophaga ginsengisegetis]MDR6647951.1 O-acetyl-ADP-ribose deacetylase (regulator of RNase III) [Chitinophaga ginsengisegetis]MDR6654899.1 O-acetyl-ADP-ribose deacetylase (regulator of RNase III) [Chitinophaga ginsengisegetis]